DGARLRSAHRHGYARRRAAGPGGHPRVPRLGPGGRVVTQFVELLANGVALGCIDALIALGFVVVFKATRVVNFAYGSLLLLGAYVVGRYHDRLGFAGAVALALVVTALVAALIGVVLLRRVRLAEPGTLAILTL